MPETNAADTPGVANLTRADLPRELQLALDSAIDKNARAPAILRVTEITGYTDWVLILSGRSDRHVSAIADGIARHLRDQGVKARGVDGFGDHTWDLLDYDDFMVHVFYHPVRMHYDLESMWSDAARVRLDLPSDVMDTTDLDALASTESMPEYRGDATFGGFADEFTELEGDELGDDEAYDDEDWDDEDWDDEPEALEDDLFTKKPSPSGE